MPRLPKFNKRVPTMYILDQVIIESNIFGVNL
jgi:hypothetical protein